MNVIQLVSNKVWGGGERYAFDLSERLLQDQADVRVVTRGAKPIDDKFRSLKVPIDTAPFKGFTDLKTPGVITRMVKSFPGNDPVIIHAHDFKNAFLAVRAKKMLKGEREVKVVVTRHLIKKGKRDLINRYIYRNIDALIFVSDMVRKEFLSTNPGINSSKLHTVCNSIHNSPFPDEIGKISEDSGLVNLLYLGRISPEKGVDMLINALALVKNTNWHLDIGGTGDAEYLASLRELAKSLDLTDKVNWLGYVSDIWEEIRKADVGVVPTTGREAFGLTILEFISQGKPVITTDNGAQPEILTDGHDGLLSHPVAEDFAIAFERIISDRELRLKLGENALKTFSRFDYETFFSKIIGIYQNC